MASSVSAPRGDKNGHSLLVAISDNPEYLFGVRFLTRFFAAPGKHNYELFHVAPPAKGQRLGPYGALMGTEEMDPAVKQAYLDKAAGSFAKARELLLGAGCAEDNISAKTQFQELSRIVDILNEAEDGGRDAVVLGHRVRGWLEETLEGRDVTGVKLVKEHLPVPVWFCEPVGDKRKDVLVCVDGSELGYRMTGHVARMILREEHRVSLLRVKREGAAGPADPELIFDRCFEILDGENFPIQRVDTMIIEENNVAQAILDAAEMGRFAVVASGHSGAGRERRGQLLGGSVAMSLFKHLKGASLWVC